MQTLKIKNKDHKSLISLVLGYCTLASYSIKKWKKKVKYCVCPSIVYVVPSCNKMTCKWVFGLRIPKQFH